MARNWVLRTLALALCALWANSLTAAIIISDGFDDGGFTNGTDPNDIAWSDLTNTTPTVATDATISDGNALNVNATAGFNRIWTNFAGVTLNPGDSLTLSFDYRFTQNPADTASQFRVGLFNNGGTNNTEGNDFGYGFATNVGLNSSTGTNVWEEGVGTSILGGSPGGIVAFGTAGASVNSPNTGAHSVVYTMTRNLSGGLDFSASIDGGLAATGTDATPATTTFHVLAIGEGGVTLDYNLDNIQLEYTPVPEPSTLAVVGLGGFGLLLARRKLCSRRVSEGDAGR
jgi:hypothetical protein